MCIRDSKDTESRYAGKSSGGDPFTKDIYHYLDGGLEMIKNL